jgi:hypothetical protein
MSEVGNQVPAVELMAGSSRTDAANVHPSLSNRPCRVARRRDVQTIDPASWYDLVGVNHVQRVSNPGESARHSRLVDSLG